VTPDLPKIIAATLRNAHQEPKIDFRARLAAEILAQSRDDRECLRRVASALNLSTSRLRHLIRAEIGMSPGRFVRLVRMQATRELLENTLLSIKQICHDAGFNDTSHFVRDFKIAFGVTPTQYRQLVFHKKAKSANI
jgi:AraC-like DNA-binding protein